MKGATPGLWGKMPAHGDFVRRGWGDEVVDALDAWLSPATARRREAMGEGAFALAWGRAPLWHGALPAGVAGPEPLRLVLTPSVDRVGRLFPLVLGIAGGAAGADALEEVAYAAVAGELDADGALAGLAAAAAEEDDGREGWWAGPDALPAPLDEALLERMLAPGFRADAA